MSDQEHHTLLEKHVREHDREIAHVRQVQEENANAIKELIAISFRFIAISFQLP